MSMSVDPEVLRGLHRQTDADAETVKQQQLPPTIRSSCAGLRASDLSVGAFNAGLNFATMMAAIESDLSEVSAGVRGAAQIYTVTEQELTTVFRKILGKPTP